MRGSAIVAAWLVAGVVGAGAQQMDARTQAAAKVYYDCLRDMAARLDDRISDAASVAIGVAGACQSSQRDLAVASSKGNFQLQQLMQRELAEKSIGSATSFVLASRTHRNKPAPAKPKPKGEGI